MATALSEEELDNEDYYSLLNVRREASSEELKAAYRRLCMLYHPDKHRDPELKSQAERLFNLVHQAYEVLSDPQTRAIYDIYGKKGLEMEGWEVVERRRAPAEIREEFERLQREREERKTAAANQSQREPSALEWMPPTFLIAMMRSMKMYQEVASHRLKLIKCTYPSPSRHP